MKRLLVVCLLATGCATIKPAKLSPAEVGLPRAERTGSRFARELQVMAISAMPRLRLRSTVLGATPSVDYMLRDVSGPSGSGSLVCSTGTATAAWQTPSGCFGTSFSLDASGTTTSSPAALGWSNWAAGEAIRISFGDLGTAIQVGYGDRLQLYSYHGMDIIAGRASLTPPAFVVGGGSTDSINMTAGATGKIIANSPFQIGSSGTSISASYATTIITSGSPATVAPNSCNTAYQTATLTGATTTAVCDVSEQFSPNNLVPRCRVSAANTVALVLCNITASNLAPPAASTYSIRVYNP